MINKSSCEYKDFFHYLVSFFPSHVHLIHTLYLFIENENKIDEGISLFQISWLIIPSYRNCEDFELYILLDWKKVVESARSSLRLCLLTLDFRELKSRCILYISCLEDHKGPAKLGNYCQFHIDLMVSGLTLT